MKKILFVACFISSFIGTVAQNAQKKALVIAIGDYDPKTYWGKISSDKDVPLITKALGHHGFKDIRLLQDSAATKDGIINAIKMLTNSVKPGDIVVIHYSGHGQQVWDKNGDELDKRDEALVPINAPAKYIKGVYEGENHLTDDELEFLMGELRMKLGEKGSLTLIFDACHSGTATRGIAPSRGTALFMGPDDAEYVPVKDEKTYSFDVKTRGEAKMAPMVLFSGASAEELNYETQDEAGNYVGSLSFALSKVLLNSDQNTTYREIFDRVRKEMLVLAPKQSPQIEGDVNLAIFGGKGSPKQNYYKAEKALNDKSFIINSGQLMGLNNGTKVAIYPANTLDIAKSKPLATGIVNNATLIKSDLIINENVKSEVILNGWIFITEQTFQELKVKVKVDIPGDPALAEAIKKEIGQFSHVLSITDKQPDVIVEKGTAFTRGAQLQVITKDEMILMNKQGTESPEATAADITRGLLGFVQAQFIRELDSKDENIDVIFEIIPITEVKTVEEGTGRFVKKSTVEVSRGHIQDKLVNGELVLKAGDHFKIKLTNRGREVAYFTLVNIQPDNQINVVIPAKGLPPAEFKILPGETKELDRIYRVSSKPPFGVETFKLIATKEPIDLSSIVNNGGNSTRGEKTQNSPFEKLFQSTYKENTRGIEEDEETTLPPESANIFNLVFKSVEN